MSYLWQAANGSKTSAADGWAILVPDDREHFALLSVGLNQPGNDLQTGSVRRAPTFDESSIYANDHPLGRFIRFSILGNFPLYLFVDAVPNSGFGW
jgi:hypothetical protein